MDEIVVKLAPEEGGAARSLDFAVDSVVRVAARTAGGQKKYAEAWPELADGKVRSRWGLYCDEGAAIGGADSAPPPLVYFAAAVAF